MAHLTAHAITSNQCHSCNASKRVSSLSTGQWLPAAPAIIGSSNWSNDGSNEIEYSQENNYG